MTRLLDSPRLDASYLSPLNLPPLIAIFLSLISVLTAHWVSDNIYERIPHVEDEFAYLWQAQVFANGQAFISSPPHHELFVVPFAVDYQGRRFSKYPPGWSILLSFGVLVGAAAWVNPILAGMGIWLTFRLGQKIFDNSTALITIGLLAVSPFFLLNSGSLLTHPWSLFLYNSLTLAWLDLFFVSSKEEIKSDIPVWIKYWVAGLCLGVLVLTRPITAVGVGLPYFIHGLILLWRGTNTTRKHVLAIGSITGVVALMLPLWQYLLSGDPFLNFYSLWASNDKIGFGNNLGTQPGGFNIFWAVNNLVLSLKAGNLDVFGWPGSSFFFVPIGIWAVRYNKFMRPILGTPATLALAYSIYWISPNRYGPRYYYEGLVCVSLISAAGITWLINSTKKEAYSAVKRGIIVFLLLVLIGYNLSIYLPTRFTSMRNIYNINRDQQSPFLTDAAKSMTPALIIVHTQKWTDCAGLYPLQDPWLTTPFIFGCDKDNLSQSIGDDEYPGRKILHYYPETRELVAEKK